MPSDDENDDLYPHRCGICKAPFVKRSGVGQTLLGYGKQEGGHCHDDNCYKRFYLCERGHKTSVSKRNACPVCDWKGKANCFCHAGLKVDEWPEAVDMTDAEATAVWLS